ncbi:MAG: ornithine cyclodeaminase family protein [Desulfobacteraceae bacterium]|nr:ornithine cyclodeaminase family protein [Desulfobacteraceae bacterium]
MQIRILTANDVRAALPMPKAIDAMKQAFGQLSAGQAVAPLRSQVSSDKGVTLLMPAYLQKTGDLGIKIVSVYGDNPGMGLPVVTATALVLDSETGLPKAFMDGSSLTAIRTGAGGGLAAELLARQNAETVALFGAGVQARAQLQAVMVVRTIKQVNLISRSMASTEKFAREIEGWSDAPKVKLAATPRDAIGNADIVITATTSPTPLFNGDDLRPGTHVTGVGSYTPEMREVDEKTVRRALIVVDSREACLAEAGDIIIPEVAIDAELGEIVNGLKPGRRSDDEITFFKSVGVAVQDAASAAAVLAEAEKKGLGTVIRIDD